MGDELHKLFLFEFLVHSVNYSNSTLKLDANFLKSLGPTCVQFKSKHLPCLIVSEIDFCPKDAFNSNVVKFKSGKSSLFSLGNTIITDCEIRGEITVKRKLPEGCASNFYCLGKSPLVLNNKFINVLNSPGITPMSQCVKLCLDLKNSINETVGSARILLRLTCFGTVIVTEFQKNVDESKGFLFKGDKIIPLEPEASGYGTIGRDSKYISSQRDINREQDAQRYSGFQNPVNINTIPAMYNNMNQGQCPQNQQFGQPMFNQMPMPQGQQGFYQQNQQPMMNPMMQTPPMQSPPMQCPPGCYPGFPPQQQQQQFPNYQAPPGPNPYNNYPPNPMQQGFC